MNGWVRLTLRYLVLCTNKKKRKMELKSYQTGILEKIKEHPRRIIAADTGCGKTAIGIHAIEMFAPEVKNALLIVPSNKTEDWIYEYKKWYPNVIISEYPCNISKECKLVVSTTRIVRKEHFDIISNRKWDIVIVDEAHEMKSYKSQRSTRLVPFVACIPRVLLLSATPQTNMPSDLYNLLFMVDPLRFTNRKAFSIKYCGGHLNKWGGWDERGAQNEDELHLILSKYMIRSKKSEVLPDLPSTSREMVYLDPSNHIEQLKKCKAEYYRLLQQNTKKGTKRATDLVKQYTLHWWRTTGSVKAHNFIEWFKQEYANSEPTDKFLIWCHHIPVAENIFNYIKNEMELDCLIVHGKNTKPKTRSEAFDPLRSLDHPLRIGICTYQSCESGLTIVPGPNRVIFVELPNIPYTVTQAEGRVHRIGSTRPVKYQWLILKSSYDELLIKKLNKKSRLFDVIVDGVPL